MLVERSERDVAAPNVFVLAFADYTLIVGRPGNMVARVAFARAFAEDLAPGSQLLLLSHALPVGVDQFALERTLDVACSWAPRVPAYLYRKRTARWRRPGDTPADAS